MNGHAYHKLWCLVCFRLKNDPIIFFSQFMMIKREKYLNDIRKVMGKQVIKVLLGMRRVGKATLLLQIQEEFLNQKVEKDQI